MLGVRILSASMMMDAWKVKSRGSRWRNELMIIDMLPFRHRVRPSEPSAGVVPPPGDIFYNSGTVSNSRSSSYTYVNGVPSCVPSERAYVWLCMRVEVEAQFDVEGALRSGLLPPLHEMHSRPRRRFASKMKTSSEKSVVFGAMGVRREGHPVTLFGQSDNSKLKPSTTSSGWAPSWHNRVTGHPAGLLALSEFCEEQTPGWPRRQINGTIIQKNSVVATSGQHRLPSCGGMFPAADVTGVRLGKLVFVDLCRESQACATLPVPDYRNSNTSTCDRDHFWKWTPESTQLISRKRSPVLNVEPAIATGHQCYHRRTPHATSCSLGWQRSCHSSSTTALLSDSSSHLACMCKVPRCLGHGDADTLALGEYYDTVLVDSDPCYSVRHSTVIPAQWQPVICAIARKAITAADHTSSSYEA
ncbi:hypothetical protein EV401DRAFT_1890368 [Pisolithus croceorrhizus]|nr:hypothetical protein EV401DRAFT_1890368 [Pisolithus croceorrhizus]